MTGNLRHMNNVMNHKGFVRSDIKVRASKEVKATEESMPLVHESCNYSTFSFVAAVSGLLVFAGIILYALIA
jgi:hypothetical protein